MSDFDNAKCAMSQLSRNAREMITRTTRSITSRSGPISLPVSEVGEGAVVMVDKYLAQEAMVAEGYVTVDCVAEEPT